MMKTVVIYKSISGFTRRYARWISRELDADIYRQSEVKSGILDKYDTIIYGGSLHAVGIYGLKKIKKRFNNLKGKNFIIFAVGASPYKKKILDEVMLKNFDEEQRKKIKLFYLRGGFDLRKLDFFHKVLMTVFRWVLSSKKDKTEDEKGMLAAYSKPVDFTKKENIRELVKYVKSLS